MEQLERRAAVSGVRCRRRSRHTETRRLPPAATSGGTLDVNIEFVVSKRRRKRRCRLEADAVESPAAAEETGRRRSRLRVNTQSALPGTAGDRAAAGAASAAARIIEGWRLVQVTRGEPGTSPPTDATSTSTVSVQCSEAPQEADAATIVGGDFGDGAKSQEAAGGGARKGRQRPQAEAARSVSQRLRELEAISRRLGRVVVLKRAAPVGGVGGGANKLAQTRDYLLMLRSLTDNALSLIGSCQAGGDPGITGAPNESRTFSSQQVQPSERGTLNAQSGVARTPPGTDGSRRSARCHSGQDWLTAGPLLPDGEGPLERRCARVTDAWPPGDLWLGCLVCRLPHLTLCRALRHSGHHPVVSRALFSDAMASRFPSQHLPYLSATTGNLHSPQLLWLLCRPPETAQLWVPPGQSSASLQPTDAPLLGVCGVQRAAVTAPDRWASHRMLRPLGASVCGGAASCQLLVAAFASATSFELAEGAAAPESSESAAAAAPASATACYSPSSHCLRLAARLMPAPSAQRLRPRVSAGDRALAAAAAAATRHPSPPVARVGEPLVRNSAWSPTESPSAAADTAALMSFGDSSGSGLKSTPVLASAPLSDASGDRPDVLLGRDRQLNNCNAGSSEGSAEPPMPRMSDTGGWDYVYLRSQDNEVRLVELQDSQDKCSTVSTVLGLFGFTASVILAVPTHLLPPRAVPVMSGNVIELGDWDISSSEQLLRIDRLAADGFAFFESRLCSNYSAEEEVEFRFAIVVPAADSSSSGGGMTGAEVVCWEGNFLRRFSECQPSEGGFFLLGRQKPLADPRDLLELRELPSLVPGWLTDSGQAALLLQLDPPQFADRFAQLTRLPAAVEFAAQASDSGPPSTLLTPNYRGPLVEPREGAAAVATPADGAEEAAGGGCATFAAAADIRVEFTQVVPLDTAVCHQFNFRFFVDDEVSGGGVRSFVEATAQLTLTATADTPEEASAVCELTPRADDEPDGRGPVGRVTVRVRCLRCCRRCPLDALRGLDRCGSASPPPEPHPIAVAPLPDGWIRVREASAAAAATPPAAAVASAGSGLFFELPIGVSPDGGLRLVCGGADATRGELCVVVPPDVGLVVRVFQDAAAAGSAQQAVELAADSVLALLLSSDRWVMLAAHDMRMCLALALKQMRLPVAFVAASEAEASGALSVCGHYGVRAIAVPTAAITDRLLGAVAAAGGPALYAYGGGGAGRQAARDAAGGLLEGTFAEGTFAEGTFAEGTFAEGTFAEGTSRLQL